MPVYELIFAVMVEQNIGFVELLHLFAKLTVVIGAVLYQFSEPVFEFVFFLPVLFYEFTERCMLFIGWLSDGNSIEVLQGLIVNFPRGLDQKEELDDVPQFCVVLS